MKPEIKKCLNCNDEISRGKYCSDKCRMAFKRNPNKPEQKGEQINPNTNISQPEQPNPNIDEFRATLTKTDRTFYDRNDSIVGKDYYRFGTEVREEKCLQCGDRFKTGMSMLRFCSYAHYKEAIRV